MAYTLFDGDPENAGSEPIGQFRLNATDDAIVFEHIPSGETLTLNSAGVQGVADDPHGNSSHTVDYAADPHDNGSHSEQFAIQGNAQPPQDHDNAAHTEDYITASEVPDSSGTGYEQAANVVYADDYATVNAAIADNTGGDKIVVVLPTGTSTFDGALPWSGYDLHIVGQGSDLTTLESSGQNRIVNEFNDSAGASLRIDGVEIDGNGVSGSDRYFNVQGERDSITLHDVTVRNLDIGTPDTTHGVIHLVEPVEDVEIENCEFRFDTFTGRPQYNVKYRVLHVPDSNSIGSLHVRDTVHVGKLMDHENSARQSENEDYFNGYKALVDEKANVSGCEFDHWGQYATFLIGNAEGCSIQLDDCTTRNHGSGDQFRTGANADGVVIAYSNITDSGTPTVNGHKVQGDRTVIVQNYGDSIPDTVTIDGLSARDSLTPIDIQGGMCSVSNAVLRNVGNLDAGGSRPIFITSQRSVAGHITLDNVTVRNARSEDPDVSADDPRFMDRAVDIADHSNNAWYGAVHISNCKFLGFTDAYPINDEDAGATVPTQLSNNYARDIDGNAPSNMLASQ